MKYHNPISDLADTLTEMGTSSHRIRLLHVEDDHLDRLAVQRYIEKQDLPYDLIQAETLKDARDEIQKGDIRIALIDYNLPDGSGLELLSELEETPCVFITGVSEVEMAVTAMKAGASDFLTKDTKREYLGLLAVTIEKALLDQDSRNQLKEYQSNLESKVSEATANLEQTNRALVREIRERRRAERDLQDINERLEQALRDLHSTQEQYVQSERLAAVGEMAAGIAHDFNNILAGILGYAELWYLDPEAPEDVKDTMGKIRDLGERAARLIRQILDFGRRSISHPKALDLRSVLDEICEFLRHTLPRNLTISLETKGEMFSVFADPTQLQQVFTNLAVNARDAMPDGGTLTFSLSRYSLTPDEEIPCVGLTPGEWVSVKISDTGVGIAPESLQHLFEPFFTTKKRGQGTGLGLSQVHGIVKQHGGHICVESRVGVGTVFSLYFPLSYEGGAPTEETGALEGVPRGHGETILVVEDQPDVLSTCQAMLEYLNYQVLTATNGKQGLDVFVEHPSSISMVLSDVVMPEMDGFAMCNLIRDRDPIVPIIMMSGYPSKQGKEPGMKSYGWIQKPVTYRKAAQMIHDRISI